MKKRKLGRTGLDVSPIAIGGAAFTYVHKAGGWDPMSEDGKKIVWKTLNECLDRGINYIDTAPAYGNGYSETLVGEVMKTRRKDCVLASKVWYELDRKGVLASVDESLERLQTDHIDILQIHGRMYKPEEVRHILEGGVLEALLEAKKAGKIGHIGITSEEPWTLIPFLAYDAIEVYQIAYNFIYQAAARHFLIEAAKVSAGVVSMRTMTSGILQREVGFLAPHIAAQDLYEIALKFVLSDSRIAAGIVGMRFPHEVEQNAKLVEGFTPPSDFATMPRLTFEVYRAEDAGTTPRADATRSSRLRRATPAS
jgi:aryl-alcohol dehydrogenase-like predicted oxidoreductase